MSVTVDPPVKWTRYLRVKKIEPPKWGKCYWKFSQLCYWPQSASKVSNFKLLTGIERSKYTGNGEIGKGKTREFTDNQTITSWCALCLVQSLSEIKIGLASLTRFITLWRWYSRIYLKQMRQLSSGPSERFPTIFLSGERFNDERFFGRESLKHERITMARFLLRFALNKIQLFFVFLFRVLLGKKIISYRFCSEFSLIWYLF